MFHAPNLHLAMRLLTKLFVWKQHKILMICFTVVFLVKREIVDLMLRSPEKLQKQVGTGLKASYLSLGILSPGGIEDFFQLDGMFMN